MLTRWFIFCVIMLSASCHSQSQVLTPTHWTVESSSKSVTIGQEIEIIFKAQIDEDWYTYSVGFDPDCGPILMTAEFEGSKGVQMVGHLRAVGDKPKHDETFGCDVRVFYHNALLKQTLKITDKTPIIKGYFEGQVCTEGKCIPFGDDFVVSLTVTGVDANKIAPIKNKELVDSVVMPERSPRETASDTSGFTPQKKDYGVIHGPVLKPEILEGSATYEQESFWALLIFAFIAGLTSLVTPCVFPMIPMTVTFFLKDTQSRAQGIRKAIIFGISIVLLYSLAGTIFAVSLGAEGLNALATNWVLNLFVFLIFIIFALSFFGLFEINAPHKLVNKVDRQAEKGGLVGIFFMAFTLVLISFSCTVPIVGSVLALSAGGAILKPILMMLAYSVAFALPFTFFAFFPELIKSLPKSGGWLNTVKVSLAFLELALSLKFFSIADQAYHWGLLDREINIGLWIVIFLMLGFYLLGKLRTPNDSPIEKVSVVRLMLSIAIFSFVVYLIPGLWGAPLKALAGYLPPLYTHDFNLLEAKTDQAACEEPKYAEFLHLPHGLGGYFDYEQALLCARKQNKPLFIDFTGHGCTNCREMEATVWSNPDVMKRLRNDFVVVALYVDDKTELPESEWYTAIDGKVKKTIGKQNADLQITNLDNNAQPFYVLVGPDETVLAWPYAYNKEPSKFLEFLDRGLRKYKELY